MPKKSDLSPLDAPVGNGVEWVRVRDESTGAQISVPKALSLLDGLSVLDKPAVDATGNPLPAKPRVALSKPSGEATKAESKPAKKAAAKKESSR